MLTSLKTAIGHVVTPRNHTDRQSELLNLVAAPIYVYTITAVTYYGIFDILPYFHGDVDVSYVDGNMIITEIGPGSWALLFHRFTGVFIYFQMMANWTNIRFVGNKPDRRLPAVNRVDQDLNSNLSSVVVNTERQDSSSKGNKKWRSKVPDPVSAPPPRRARKAYWAWKVCVTCQLNAPPRCHHCPMCATCILKRDHHCFFAGRCVGFYNQRHFIIFLIWAVLGTTYASVYFIPFLFKVLLHRNYYLDIFPPFALLRWIFGGATFQLTNYMFAFFLNLFFVVLSSNFLHEQYDLVSEGKTQFEVNKVNKKRLTIVDPRNMADKIRAVIGYNYGISIFFPLAHWFIKPHENPYEWPEHKILRH